MLPIPDKEINKRESSIHKKVETFAKFNIGDTVFHRKYGEGRVLSHSNGTYVYQVKFDFSKAGLFINENDLKLVAENYDYRPKVKSSEEPKDFQQIPVRNVEFEEGEIVLHFVYGIGVILRHLNNSNNYEVKFNNSFGALTRIVRGKDIEKFKVEIR